jgi:hypothetical protein
LLTSALVATLVPCCRALAPPPSVLLGVLRPKTSWGEAWSPICFFYRRREFLQIGPTSRDSRWGEEPWGEVAGMRLTIALIVPFTGRFHAVECWLWYGALSSLAVLVHEHFKWRCVTWQHHSSLHSQDHQTQCARLQMEQHDPDDACDQSRVDWQDYGVQIQPCDAEVGSHLLGTAVFESPKMPFPSNALSCRKYRRTSRNRGTIRVSATVGYMLHLKSGCERHDKKED